MAEREERERFLAALADLATAEREYAETIDALTRVAALAAAYRERGIASGRIPESAVAERGERV